MSTRRPIPKFASFKPPTPEVSDADFRPASPPAREREPGRKSHRQHRFSDDRDRTDNGKKHSRVSSPQPAQETKRPRHNDKLGHQSEVSVLLSQPQPSSLFFVDRKGDPQNLTYGRLHRYDLPSFRRFGAGYVVGTAPGLRIDRDLSDGDTLLLSVRSSNNLGFREKYAFSRMERKGVRLLRIVPQEGSIDHDQIRGADFIPVSRKRQKLSHESDDSGEDECHYRSIQGKAKTQKDADMEYATDSDSDDGGDRRRLSYHEQLKQKTIALSRAVDVAPTSIDAWVHLIDHQDSLLGLTDDSRRKITNAEKRSTADLKVHLYEKALSKMISLRDKEQLLIGLMEEGAKFWDVKTQADRWQKIASEHLDSQLLWCKYINFQQSKFNSFHFEQVRDIYRSRLDVLREALQLAIAKSDPIRSRSIHEQLVYTVLRATIFIREAGYTELAVGIWQAILELNFCGSEIAEPERLRSLEEFWDAEVPRIGEENAQGLDNFCGNKDQAEVPAPKTDQSSSLSLVNGKTIFDSWKKAEYERSLSSQMPARTMDDVVNDDPYRVIIWSDVESYMLDISPEDMLLKRLIIDAWLIFCGLPPIASSSDSCSNQWWKQGIISGVDLEWKSNVKEDAAMDLDDLIAIEQARATHSKQLRPCFEPSADNLFPAKHLPCYIPVLRDVKNDHPDLTVSTNWVRNSLASIATKALDEDIFEYWLAFVSASQPDMTKKVAKGLLKQNPTSLRLYNAYALTEANKGNTEMAINIISAALSMQTPSHDSILLWRTWVWVLIDSNSSMQAYKCLLAIGGDSQLIHSPQTPSQAALLRAKQHLSTTRDFLEGSSQYHLAVHYEECLALIEYFSADGSSRNLDFYLSHIESYTTSLLIRSPAIALHSLQILHQSATRLITHHITTSKLYRPSTIRSFLTEALIHFPQNTILLSSYAHNELHQRISNNVRTLLTTRVLLSQNETLTSHLFAITHELQHGNIHSQHAAFETAVSSIMGGQSPGLWKLFVEFCKKNQAYKTRVKEVFGRGMRACPWHKGFLMVGFGLDVGDFGWDERKGLYGMLVEKGHRIHVDIEEELDEMFAGEGGGGVQRRIMREPDGRKQPRE